MRIAFLCNPKAGLAKRLAGPDEDDEVGLLDRLRQQLQLRGEVRTLYAETPEQTDRLVTEAVAGGCDTLVVGGGDGTIHAAVNALAPDFDRCRLVLLPLGTGNDLCRTLGIPDTLPEALALYDNGRERPIDLLRVETPARTRYGVNAASGGFSGQLKDVLTDELKSAWGPLAYLRAAAGVLPDLLPYEAELTLDGEPARTLTALNVIVANGRFAARGWEIASRANPEDGLLDVVVVRDAPVIDLAEVAAQLLAGDYLNSDHVEHFRAGAVTLRAEPIMSFSVDGEWIEENPITFTLMPRALRIVVGPDYDPEGGE